MTTLPGASLTTAVPFSVNRSSRDTLAELGDVTTAKVLAALALPSGDTVNS
jgi:hypothetical protein